MTATAPATNETVTRRRISWAALYKERPDLRPANDNQDVDRFGGASSLRATGAASTEGLAKFSRMIALAT